MSTTDDQPAARAPLTDRQRRIVQTIRDAIADHGYPPSMREIGDAARLGYLAADPAVADALRLVRLPYHLSAVTQATAEAALDHVDALLRTVEDIKAQRDRIVSTLRGLGLRPSVSDSNFVFFGHLEDASDVWRRLLDRGVLVRDVGIPHHLRVTAGTEAETTAFLTALEEVLGETGHRS